MDVPSTVQIPVRPPSDAHGEGEGVPRFMIALTACVLLTVVLHATLWITGFQPRRLTMAVDEGAARIVSKGVGEMADDVIRKSIEVQKRTLPFWTVLLRLSDFVIDPMFLVLRALVVATMFAALAALTGRPIRFGRALDECATAQFIWVAGLATRVAIAVALRLPDAETSAVLLLDPGRYHASVVVLLRQVDPFVIYGWLRMAWSAWRRGQANLPVCLLVCASLAFGEALVRCLGVLFAEGGMRLSILPDTMGR